jgi:hypothetical protein
MDTGASQPIFLFYYIVCDRVKKNGIKISKKNNTTELSLNIYDYIPSVLQFNNCSYRRGVCEVYRGTGVNFFFWCS